MGFFLISIFLILGQLNYKQIYLFIIWELLSSSAVGIYE